MSSYILSSEAGLGQPRLTDRLRTAAGLVLVAIALSGWVFVLWRDLTVAQGTSGGTPGVPAASLSASADASLRLPAEVAARSLN